MQLLFQTAIENSFLLECESNEGTFHGVHTASINTGRREEEGSETYNEENGSSFGELIKTRGSGLSRHFLK